ncbi:MAG: DNA/RNA non-specific endonuclease [Coleofasciculus sp. B1-GNL1-01]
MQEEEVRLKSDAGEGVIQEGNSPQEQEAESQQETSHKKNVRLTDISTKFLMDVDGDGEMEQKRLFFTGEGEQAHLMLNPEPIPFLDFLNTQQSISSDQTVKKIVNHIRQEIKKNISQERGKEIASKLQELANYLSKNYNVRRPPSLVSFETIKISYNNKISEYVTKSLKAQPLSSNPGKTVGSGVQQPKTELMTELRKWAPYVRGHMLNAKLHGPGEDKNLVPISVPFNKKMETEIEHKLKQEVLGNNKVVSYTIEPQNWGKYPGAKNAKANNVQNILPAEFKVEIYTMRLKKLGADGSKEENWKKDKQPILDKEFTHDQPTQTNFNYEEDPKKILPGYGEMKSGVLYENPVHQGRWVVQGEMRWRSYRGTEQIISYPDPVILTASQQKGTATMEQNGNDLIVKCDDAAKKTVKNHKKERISNINNLKKRTQEISDSLKDQENKTEVIKKRLDKTKTSVKEINDIATGNEKADEEDKLYQLRQQNETMRNKVQGLTTSISNLESEIKQFWEEMESLVKKNISQFWNEQQNREEQNEKELTKKDELTNEIQAIFFQLQSVQTQLNQLERQIKAMPRQIQQPKSKANGLIGMDDNYGKEEQKDPMEIDETDNQLIKIDIDEEKFRNLPEIEFTYHQQKAVGVGSRTGDSSGGKMKPSKSKRRSKPYERNSTISHKVRSAVINYVTQKGNQVILEKINKSNNANKIQEYKNYVEYLKNEISNEGAIEQYSKQEQTELTNDLKTRLEDKAEELSGNK